MGAFIYQWIDFLWLPIAWFAVHKAHRVGMVIFAAVSILTMRTQVELVESTGFVTGFLPVMDSSLFTRGVIVYSVMIAIFLLLAHYSPRATGYLFLAAAVSFYIGEVCLSMIVMVL